MRVAIDVRKAADFGIGTYIRGLVDGLSQLDAGLQLVLIGDRETYVGAPAGVEWIETHAAHYGWRELLEVGRAARRGGAHVFHAPHYVYPLHLPCPGVVTIHDCIHLRFPEYLPRPFGLLPRSSARSYARWMMRRAGRRAARVITVSQATRRDLGEFVGLPEERIAVIANGVARSGPPDDAAARRLALGLSPRRAYILFVGNAKPHKNLPLLLRAFERCSAAYPELDLVAAGRLRDAAAAVDALPSDVRARVHRFDEVSEDDLWALYGGAHAVCVPSRYEGFGLPAAEAMRAGTPVIAAAAGGLPEVVGDAGLLVPVDDVEALAGAILKLLEDGALRDELARRGRQRASGFTWETAARATLQVYRQATGDTP